MLVHTPSHSKQSGSTALYLITQWTPHFIIYLISILLISLLSTANVKAETSQYWSLPVPLQGSIPVTMTMPSTSLRPEDCGKCHAVQYNEWRQSFHAKAVSSGLLGQLSLFDEATTRDCLNCHAPRSEQQNALLEHKQTPAHGVDCASCHVRQHLRYSARKIINTPHGHVLPEPLFTKSDFCAPCHQFGDEGIVVNGTPLENTLEEWRNSRYPAQGETCQSCHMRDGSHTFAGIHDPDMVKMGLSVTVKRTKTNMVLTLHNKGAGHALPSYVTPRIRVLWHSDDGQKKNLAVLQRLMEWHADTGWSERFDTRLQAHERRDITVNITEDSSGWVEVWIDPDADYHDRVYPAILQAMKEDSTDPEAIELIKQAHMLSATSTYRLLRLRCDEGGKHECR